MNNEETIRRLEEHRQNLATSLLETTKAIIELKGDGEAPKASSLRNPSDASFFLEWATANLAPGEPNELILAIGLLVFFGIDTNPQGSAAIQTAWNVLRPFLASNEAHPGQEGGDL